MFDLAAFLEVFDCIHELTFHSIIIDFGHISAFYGWLGKGTNVFPKL